MTKPLRARSQLLALPIGLIVLASLGGCATLTESNQQTLLLQTIQDNREIGGVGCVLSNKLGRWFVMSPGRVTVQRSLGELTIDCRKDGVGSATESVRSRASTSAIWGNLVVSAGLGYFVDENTGAGFDYPSTLTIIMHKPPPVAPPAVVDGGTTLY